MTYDNSSGFATDYLTEVSHQQAVPKLGKLTPLHAIQNLGLTEMAMANVVESFAVSSSAFTS